MLVNVTANMRKFREYWQCAAQSENGFSRCLNKSRPFQNPMKWNFCIHTRILWTYKLVTEPTPRKINFVILLLIFLKGFLKFIRNIKHGKGNDLLLTMATCSTKLFSNILRVYIYIMSGRWNVAPAKAQYVITLQSWLDFLVFKKEFVVASLLHY